MYYDIMDKWCLPWWLKIHVGYLQSDKVYIQARKGLTGVAIAKSNKCMPYIHQCINNKDTNHINILFY